MCVHMWPNWNMLSVKSEATLCLTALQCDLIEGVFVLSWQGMVSPIHSIGGGGHVDDGGAR